MSRRTGGALERLRIRFLLPAAIAVAGSGPATAAEGPPRIERAYRSGCESLTTPAGLRLAVVGHYEGAALSTVWLGDADEPAEVADLRILPGEPIHLVIAGYSRTIYRFSGQTSRVRRLTLMNDHAAGAVGIPASRVEFSRRCLAYGIFYDSTPEAAATPVLEVYGRPADFSGGAYSLWRVEIGTAVRAIPAPRVRARLDVESQALFSFSPGGVAEIDPVRVVSGGPVGRYEVLPQEAGVRQLVESGALVKATREDAERWLDRVRARGMEAPSAPYGLSYGIYRVVRPILIPAGLCGSHSIALYAPSRDYVRGRHCHSTLYFYDEPPGDAAQR